MTEKRRALGRGLGALIPSGAGAAERPVDVLFKDRQEAATSDGAAPAAGVANDGPPAPTNGANGQTGAAALATPGAPGPTAAEIEEADTGGLRPVPGAEFAEISLDDIRPNPRQPRGIFDEDELAELAHSIREIGVLQPVVVR